MTAPHPLAQVNQAAWLIDELWADQERRHAWLFEAGEQIRAQDTEEDQHNGR